MVTPVASYGHDPQAELDYGFDFSSWLNEDDTIESATWTVPDDLAIESQADTTTTSVVEISGGTAGETYDVTCHVVTADGLEDDRTIRLYCRER